MYSYSPASVRGPVGLAAPAVSYSLGALVWLVLGLVVINSVFTGLALHELSRLRSDTEAAAASTATVASALTSSVTTDLQSIAASTATSADNSNVSLSVNNSGVETRLDTVDTTLKENVTAGLEDVRLQLVNNRLQVDQLGNFPVSIGSPLTAFGEVRTAGLNIGVGLSFAYNEINTRLMETFLSGGGAVTAADGLMSCTTTSALYDYAVVRSIRRVRYIPGVGALARFTAIFGNTTANALYLVGPANAGNGFLYGYNGENFGVMHRRGGRHEVWLLTFTTASTAAENATVTVAGTNYTVPLTDSTGATTPTHFSASEVANFEGIPGWDLFGQAATVTFFAADAAAKSDDFAFYSGGTAAASFSKVRDGVAPTETWTYQDDWNMDTLNGSGTSGMTIDPTKGNVYQIEYQWLGFGNIHFSVENPVTSEFIRTHTIQYPNNNTELSIEVPSLQLMYAAASLGSTIPLSLQAGSAAGFIEGDTDGIGLPNAVVHTETGVTTERNVVCVRVRAERNGVPIHSEIHLTQISVAVEGTKPAAVKFLLEPTSVGAASIADHTEWQAVSLLSFVQYETTSTTASGGTTVLSQTLAKSGTLSQDLSQQSYTLQRTQRACVRASSSASTEVTVALTWQEYT